MGVPYDYMSTQTVAKIDDLRAKYDVILFPPVGFNASTSLMVNGLPTTWGNAMPWKETPETPNLVGKNDSTDDIRPGLGWKGVAGLQEFVAKGGVLVTVADTSRFAVSIGLTEGVNLGDGAEDEDCRVGRGDSVGGFGSPIAYGYDEKVAGYCDNGPIFGLTSIAGERRRRHLGTGTKERPTGRGGVDDPDFIVGRPGVVTPEEPYRGTLGDSAGSG